MASLSIFNLAILGDVTWFAKLKQRVACLVPFGEIDNIDGDQARVSKVCFGPFLKPSAISNELPQDYLLTVRNPTIFHENFADSQN